MRDHQTNHHREWEILLRESDWGCELLDMLAQANIDFRRLPPEELYSLMEKFRPSPGIRRRQTLAVSPA